MPSGVPKHCEQCGQEIDALLNGQCPRCLLDAGLASTVGEMSAVPEDSILPSFARYRIVRVIGGGGMGVVYEAQQEHPRRTVALKVVKPGMASPEVLRRFEQEAEALGRLQHPGIAQIYEAGTADSGTGPQPYFAMELVHGRNLRRYTAGHRLSTREALDIAAKIADAVHHAHQRGLIHRDLKPSNILIDETGQPKVVDFGVARLADRDPQASAQTDAGQLVGTLAYMSPEQVLADPRQLDIRSDVYALGVILYELLAAKLPYDVGGQVHQAIRTICEEEPPSLSSVRGDCRGDIETIVAKALEKDKARRYSSAAELASDLRRHLADEPIIARPPSLGYQLSKFSRRNRSLVGGIAAVFFVLAVGIVVSLNETARANAAERVANQSRDRAVLSEKSAQSERDRALVAERTAAKERDRATVAELQARLDRDKAVAEQKRADNESAAARALNDFFGKDLLQLADPLLQIQAARPNQPAASINPEITIREALDRASARFGGRLDKQPLAEAGVRESIGEIYYSMRLFSEATRQFERAAELRVQALGPRHDDALRARLKLAASIHREDRYADAREILEVVLREVRLQPRPNSSIVREAEAGIVATYIRNAKQQDAVDFLRKDVIPYHRRVDGEESPIALDTIAQVVDVYRSWVPPRYGEAESYLKETLRGQTGARSSGKLALTTTALLAEIYNAQERFRETVTLLEPALRREWVDEVTRGGRTALSQRPYLPSLLGSLATAYSRTGDASRAAALMNDELRMTDVVLTAPGGAPTFAVPLITMAIQLRTYVNSGRRAEAAELLPRVLGAYRQVAAQKEMASLIARDLLFQIAADYSQRDDIAQSLQLNGELIAISRTALGDEDPETIRILPVFAGTYVNNDFGDEDYGEEQFRISERALQEVHDIQLRVLGPKNVEPWRTQWALSELYWHRASALKRLRKTDQTRPLLERAAALTQQVVEYFNSLPPDGSGMGGGTMNAVNRGRLSGLQGELGQLDAMEAAVTELQALQRRTRGRPEGEWVQQAALGWVQLRRKNYVRAEETLRPACEVLARSQNGQALPHRYACESQLGAALVGQAGMGRRSRSC